MNTMRIFRILGLFIFLAGGVSMSNETKAQPGVSISFQTFYNELSPYGRWVRNPQFGSVWVPDVPRGFQPYSTNGYWEVTEYGNTWVSDYDWGWAPFHYGRWSFDDYNGWFWIPDYEWGPAWVNWRSGGGYYGWAPLGPGMNVNVSINLPSFWWVFVPQRYVSYRNWYNYCPPRRRVTHVYNQTVIINNYYRSNNRTYVYGPRHEEIERVTRRSVPIRTIDASPSGRGRVIVAGNSRGDNRYDSREDSRGSRSRSERNGAVIDADRNSRGSRGNSEYNGNERIGGNVDRSERNGSVDRSERNGSFDRNERSGRLNDNSNERRGDTRTESAPRIPSEDRENMRNNRYRGSVEPSAPVENRSNNRYEAPRQPERSNREYNPGSSSPRSERSSRPSSAPVNPNPSRGSYEAPQRASRPERSAPEPRSNSRSSGENGGRGASERSSRNPR